MRNRISYKFQGKLTSCKVGAKVDIEKLLVDGSWTVGERRGRRGSLLLWEIFATACPRNTLELRDANQGIRIEGTWETSLSEKAYEIKKKRG